MAIDSQRKRQSIASVGFVGLQPTITPDGSFSQGDRQTIGYSYYGILAASPSPFVFIDYDHAIHVGMVAQTAARMQGVLVTDL